MTPTDKRTGTVLLLGNYRASLSVVRALAPLGYRIIVGSDNEGGYTEYSRFSHEYWDHPRLSEDSDGFFQALEGLLNSRSDISIIFPVLENYIQAIGERPECQLSDRIYAMSSADLVEKALDKILMMHLSRDLGVPVADFAVARDHAEFLNESDRIGLPVVVRPKFSTTRLGSEKAVICEIRQDLEENFPSWPVEQEALILQKKVDGRRWNVYFVADRGKVVLSKTAVIVRTDRTNGSGLAVCGHTAESRKDLVGYTEKLVEAIDYSGVGTAQFLIDMDRGETSFLELNPRIAGSNAVMEETGMDASRLTIDIAADRRPLHVPAATHAYGKRIRFAWVLGDMGGLRKALGDGEMSTLQAIVRIGQIGKSLLTADVHQMWAWNDPLPVLMNVFAERVPGLREWMANRVVKKKICPTPSRGQRQASSKEGV